MKQIKLFAGVTLITLSCVFTALALLFPNNAMFVAFWNIGMFTFRGEGSLMVVYIASALGALLGGFLLLSRKGKKEE